MSYTCKSCDGARPAAMLLTSLVTGETDVACSDDIPIMLIGQLAIAQGTDPTRLYDAVARHIDREIKREAKEAEAAQAAPPANDENDDVGRAQDDAQPIEGADPDDVDQYPERYGLVP